MEDLLLVKNEFSLQFGEVDIVLKLFVEASMTVSHSSFYQSDRIEN